MKILSAPIFPEDTVVYSPNERNVIPMIIPIIPDRKCFFEIQYVFISSPLKKVRHRDPVKLLASYYLSYLVSQVKTPLIRGDSRKKDDSAVFVLFKKPKEDFLRKRLLRGGIFVLQGLRIVPQEYLPLPFRGGRKPDVGIRPLYGVTDCRVGCKAASSQ